MTKNVCVKLVFAFFDKGRPGYIPGFFFRKTEKTLKCHCVIDVCAVGHFTINLFCHIFI